MANPLVKAWKYLMALFSSKVDEYADPKVQMQQALEDAQRQHAELSQQAAAVIGQQRQLEMRLNRQLGDVERLNASARQAILQADAARTAGDTAKADRLEQAAQAFATQLTAAEQTVEDSKAQYLGAEQASNQAKAAVERNAMMLQQKIAERTKLLSQLDQAKMQEQVAATMRQVSELADPGNVPSFDQIRDKIEARYAKASGAVELAQGSVQAQMLEVEASQMDLAGKDRIEQMRREMRGEPIAGASDPAAIDTASDVDTAPVPASTKIHAVKDRNTA